MVSRVGSLSFPKGDGNIWYITTVIRTTMGFDNYNLMATHDHEYGCGGHYGTLRRTLLGARSSDYCKQCCHPMQQNLLLIVGVSEYFFTILVARLLSEAATPLFFFSPFFFSAPQNPPLTPSGILIFMTEPQTPPPTPPPFCGQELIPKS